MWDFGGAGKEHGRWGVTILLLVGLCLVGRSVQGEENRPSIDVTVNQSRVLRMDMRVKTVSVAQPEIADVVVLAPTELLINGKSVGATSLVVWSNRGRVTNFVLNVTPDIDGLRKQLGALFPEEHIEVASSGSAIVLKGEVSNEVVYDKVLDVAGTYIPPSQAKKVAPSAPPTQSVNITAPPVRLPATGTSFAGGGQLAFEEENALTDVERWGDKRRHPGIIDLLVIRDFRQIQLNVVVAEISLTKLRELGVDVGVVTGRASGLSRLGSQSGLTGGNLFSDPSTFPPTVTFGQAASGIFSYISNGVAIAAVYRLLQNKDVTQILAQPNLVIKNGRSGGFLAGGEFPFPFPQSGGFAGGFFFTVEFKPFGVRLDFVPTLTWSNTIDLRVFPEVSEIDPSVSVQVGGVNVPGLRVRRTVSRVEMKEGEVLVIGGLLDRRVLRDITKFPFLGDVPILGALFRSTRFRNQETELVFVITPRIMKTLPPGTPPPVPSSQKYDDPDMRQIPLPTPSSEGGAATSGSSTSVAPSRQITPPVAASSAVGMENNPPISGRPNVP